MTQEELNRAADYNRGYVDGMHALDPERRSVCARLRKLDLTEGSHKNLSAIAEAIHHSYFGWTNGACEALRDELVRLLGGDQPTLRDLHGIRKDSSGFANQDAEPDTQFAKNGENREIWKGEDEPQDDTLTQISLKAKTYAYQILELADILGVKVNVGDNVADIGNEVITKARQLTDECNFSTTENDMDAEDAEPNPAETSDDASDHVSLGTHSIADELRQCVEMATKTYDDTAWYEFDGDEDKHTWCSVTVAELLGIAERIDQMEQDNGTGNGTCPDDVPMASITSELRRYVAETWDGAMYVKPVPMGLLEIADHIDEQFGRCCELWERTATDTAQQVHDSMEAECNKLLAECDRLTAALDELHADPANDAICRLERERDKLKSKLDELDASGATELYRLLKGTLGEAKCIADRLNAHNGELREVEAKLDRARQQRDRYHGDCQMYVDMLRDAAMEYQRLECHIAALDGKNEGWQERDEMRTKLDELESGRDTPEAIVRELTFGMITASEAIERIGDLDGRG